MRTPQTQGFKPSLVDESSSGYIKPFDSNSGSRDSTKCNYNPFDSDTHLDTVSSQKKTHVTGSIWDYWLAPDFSIPDKKTSDSEG